MDSSRSATPALPRSSRLAFVALLAFSAALASTAISPVNASPDTWMVSTTDDDAVAVAIGCPAIADAQECTLREAVRMAQDGDTIELPAGTFELHEDDGEILIDRGVRITGQGLGDSIIQPRVRGNRIFRITATAGQVILEQMTLQGGGGSGMGGAGGAITFSGGAALEIESVLFTQNFSDHGDYQPGGALNISGATGGLSISSSQFNDNSARRGAAIYIGDSSGTVSIIESTFAENLSAGGLGPSEGGAIYGFRASGEISISSSTFADNSVDDAGGAIALFDSEPVTIRSSTFSGNSAASGGALSVASGSTVDISNSTFVDNAGGLLRTTGGGNEAHLSFLTIVDHATAFDIGNTGSDGVALRHSALANVTGCTDVTVEGNVQDDASGAACADADETHPTIALTTSVDSSLHFPEHDSPLSGHSIDDCPSVDQRGVSRSDECSVGSIDLAEITCPAGRLPRDEAIECSLDVALTGSPTVTVELNPVLFDDPVPVTAGQGTFSFTIPGNAPDGTALVSVGGGAYSSSHPVEPAAGSGGGTGGGGSSGGEGSDTSEGPLRGDGPTVGAADILDELPVTGADDTRTRTTAAAITLLGWTLVGTSTRRTRRVRADR